MPTHDDVREETLAELNRTNYFVKFFMFRNLVRCITFALLIFTVFVACEKEDDAAVHEEEVPTAPIVYPYDRYVSPCLQWEANESAVRTYMKSLEGWKETPVDARVGGNHLNFSNEDDSSGMNYEFKFECLTTCVVTYYGPIDLFELLRSTVSEIFQVDDWKGHTHVGNVTWFTASNPEKFCNLEIGMSNDNGGYMYVRYAYSAYDWK